MPRKEGLVHVLTGDGNGKTTSAIGLAVRARGRGLRVAIIQFLKGGLSGEIEPLSKLGVTIVTNTKFCPRQEEHKASLKKDGHVVFCRGCFAINDKDRELTAAAFAKALGFAKGGQTDLLILDEIFPAISFGLLTADQLLSLIREKRPSCELVLTGRGAPKAAEDAADYVSFVGKKKHPFDKGTLSRAGIDY
ncbi:MAG: cob(I)yrinic acid a,c-diamide adenosyltransferase [Candidatus Micrarchaeia archaeon]